MISRRSLFSIIAGLSAVIAGAKVVEAKPVDIKWVPVGDPTPRPSHYSTGNTDPGHTHGRTAVNLRSDGTLRHRQHHQIDFPPHRN